jgi:hypothetical protein
VSGLNIDNHAIRDSSSVTITFRSEPSALTE